MVDDSFEKGPKDRSPSYPFISLRTAIERLEALERIFGRHPAPASKIGLAWNMKEKSSQAFQTVAALKGYGLVEYEGSNEARVARISDRGRTYLRAQQDHIKREVLQLAALEPKIMRTFWEIWGADRPPDPVCLDDLVLKHRFTDTAAKTFLKVYDETIEYSGLKTAELSISQPVSDTADSAYDTARFTGPDVYTQDNVRESTYEHATHNPTPSVPLMRKDERVFLAGPLSNDVEYKLIIKGAITSKELKKLIKLLAVQEEILSDE